MSLSLVTDGLLRPYFFDTIEIREQVTSLEPLIIESKSLVTELSDSVNLDSVIIDTRGIEVDVEGITEIEVKFEDIGLESEGY